MRHQTMQPLRNVLFIMCDQLRWDYLSCYGHPTLATPNIDALARRGVRFERAFVQSASCGPSRMSYYTGRYVSSHRAFGNFVALPLDEVTLGDYLRQRGLRVAVAGKTHAEGAPEALRARGIDPDSQAGVLAMQAGFEPFDRHDGVLVDGAREELAQNRYTRYLHEQGYPGANPWLSHANSGLGSDGRVLSGWEMRHARTPARVEKRHSETAYTTRRAMDFIDEQGERPWCLHLSYIKPHWPYVAPSPYHALYGDGDVLPASRHAAELDDPHPILRSYLKHPAAQSFAQDSVRRTVVPVYMGLVKQIDDELGALFEQLDRQGRFDDTLVVFTSDHGDYLGDHHLGEKELPHDAVTRVPLIVCDPRPAADATRGSADAEHLVEAIDLLPTFIDALGGTPDGDRIEGRSLQPLLHGAAPAEWREFVVSEFDYSFRSATRIELGRPVKHCSMVTLRDHDWKFVHCEGLRPMLFDLRRDPQEFFDLGADPTHEAVRNRYAAKLVEWMLARKRYTSVSDAFVGDWLADERFRGMAIGVW